MAIPQTVQAAVLTAHGGPDKLEVRSDWPVPQPAAGEVLIAVGAAGINNTDLWTHEGAYGDADNPDKRVGWRGVPLEFPRIQGLDIAGKIIAVGEAVPESRIGERVLVDAVLYDSASEGLPDARLIGSERDGGFAEYVAVPAGNAVKIDSALSDAELASFPCAHATGEHMLNRARVAAGERVLVTGASGGVGSALVQLVAARGARPIGRARQGAAPRIAVTAGQLRHLLYTSADTGSSPSRIRSLMLQLSSSAPDPPCLDLEVASGATPWFADGPAHARRDKPFLLKAVEGGVHGAD